MASIRKKALTTGEIAEYCDVNFRTVIRWIDRGLLEAYKLPGRGDNRVPCDSFIKFLKENNMPIPKDLEEKNLKILVIDDQEEMARSIARVLHRLGYEVEIAENGFIFGALLFSYKPALITLDLKMPGINGFDVLKFIKDRPELNGLKVLSISGESEKELQRAIKEGADDVLAKPFTNEELEMKIKNLLKQNSD